MNDIFTFLLLHGADIMNALTGIVAGASVLANFTRTDKDNRALTKVGRVLNFLAINLEKVTPKEPTKFND